MATTTDSTPYLTSADEEAAADNVLARKKKQKKEKRKKSACRIKEKRDAEGRLQHYGYGNSDRSTVKDAKDLADVVEQSSFGVSKRRADGRGQRKDWRSRVTKK